MYSVVNKKNKMNIFNLLSRYNLNSRTGLYKRINFLEIKLSKDNNDKAFASEEQVKLLDQLDQHIRGGGKMATFVKTSPVNVVQVNSEQLSVQQDEHESEHQSEHESLHKTNTENQLENLVMAIISNINSTEDILKKHILLEKCYENKWLLTTKEIEKILSRKVKKIKNKNYCIMNGWKFVVKGKDRNQNLWEIKKLINNN